MAAILHQIDPFLKWLGFLSLVTFVLSIALIPWLIKLLPVDYFTRSPRSNVSHGFWGMVPRLIFLLIRNLFGIFLLLAGFAMLFLPGQGILTMLLGLSMLNFPGRHKIICKLASRPTIRRGLNWIRLKTHRPPFSWIDDND